MTASLHADVSDTCPLPVDASRVDVMLHNSVGGSTTHYNAHWPRLRPVDFRKGTEHGLEGSADWPLSYEDLAPYYEENDAALGISGLAGDPAVPPRTPLSGVRPNSPPQTTSVSSSIPRCFKSLMSAAVGWSVS